MDNGFEISNVDMKLFYEDSYIEEFEATVLSCEADKDIYRVVLDQTAFFPKGEYQAGDKGQLNTDIKVLEVIEDQGMIYHITDGPVEPWDMVSGHIDFKDRLDKMCQHTAEHIVSGIVFSMFGYEMAGLCIADNETIIDYKGTFNEDDIRMLEQAANDAVMANVVIETRFVEAGKEGLDYRGKCNKEGLVRLAVIPGYDICACGAPLVRTTGELGLIKITDYESYNGGMRLHMVCARRALADYNAKEKRLKEILASK